MYRFTPRISLLFSLALSLALAGCDLFGGGSSGGSGGALMPIFDGPACDGADGSVAPCYDVATGWNAYARRSNSSVACTGAESGGYSACIHGGEFRVAEVAGVSNCKGVEAVDDLEAFTWACDERTDPIRVVSVGLAPGKYLSDLINFNSTSWRSNAVTVTRKGSTKLSTNSTVWWDNPIVEDNDGMTATSAEAGTIYTVTADAADSYNLDADSVGLVVEPDLLLTGPSDGSAVIVTDTSRFLWLEGWFDGQQTDDGVEWSADFSVMRGVRVQSGDPNGIIVDGDSNLLVDVIGANCDNYGMRVNGAANLMAGVRAQGNLTGLGIEFEADDNVAIQVTAGANQFIDTGLILSDPVGTVVIGVTAANTESDGIVLTFADRTTLINAVSASNDSSGIVVDTSDDAQLRNVASAHNGSAGIEVLDSSDGQFSGLLKVGSNSPNCSVSGGTNPGLTGSCQSDAQRITGIDLGDAFVGKVTTGDSENPNDSGGTATFASVTDWVHFENQFRHWGKNGSAFPSADHRGPCLSGTCRIWDWSLDGGDTVLLEVLDVPSGGDTITHTWSDASTTTFLADAVEILGDGVGNENGLCESDERCLFTPNIGAYQGHGDLEAVDGFQDGELEGIELFRFAENGY